MALQPVAVGRVELTILDDGTWPFPARCFFRDIAEAQWRAHLDTDAHGKIPVGHNCALLQWPDALMVIDTGYGDDTHGGRTGHLLERFERLGYRREQVTHVVSTHAHGDHIKRNTMIEGGRRVPTFPHARHYLAHADWNWFSGPGHVPEFDEQVVTLAEHGLLDLFQGPTQLTHDVSLLPTPGHTPGHTSVLIHSAGHTAIFLGDLCHHPLHFSHPDWVSSFDTHPQETPRSRAALFELALERSALLVCPHAASPGLGRLERNGSGYRWRPLA
jgi:glyoxylase-like metal-dependent hydrolase (beta-lactamase superfamily II)